MRETKGSPSVKTFTSYRVSVPSRGAKLHFISWIFSGENLDGAATATGAGEARADEAATRVENTRANLENILT